MLNLEDIKQKNMWEKNRLKYNTEIQDNLDKICCK